MIKIEFYLDHSILILSENTHQPICIISAFSQNVSTIDGEEAMDCTAIIAKAILEHNGADEVEILEPLYMCSYSDRQTFLKVAITHESGTHEETISLTLVPNY